MAINFDQQLVRTDDVLFQEVEGESVLLNLSKGEYFGLNGCGHRMWLILTESASVQQAYEKLLEEFEVEPEELRRDLDSLVDELLEHELVQIAN